MNQTEYIASLTEQGTVPVTPAAAIADLLDNMDSIPGSTIRHQGEEIWLHTAGQVEGWLHDFLEAYQEYPLLSVGKDET